MAQALRTVPPNLTLLAKLNGGVFPKNFVEMAIDGRKSLRAHGTYEMPVWGDVFSQVQKERANERIQSIVEYVRSIQQQ